MAAIPRGPVRTSLSNRVGDLPGMARSLGSGITEFKRGLREGQEKDADADKDKPKT